MALRLLSLPFYRIWLTLYSLYRSNPTYFQKRCLLPKYLLSFWHGVGINTKQSSWSQKAGRLLQELLLTAFFFKKSFGDESPVHQWFLWFAAHGKIMCSDHQSPRCCQNVFFNHRIFITKDQGTPFLTAHHLWSTFDELKCVVLVVLYTQSKHTQVKMHRPKSVFCVTLKLY